MGRQNPNSLRIDTFSVGSNSGKPAVGLDEGSDPEIATHSHAPATSLGFTLSFGKMARKIQKRDHYLHEKHTCTSEREKRIRGRRRADECRTSCQLDVLLTKDQGRLTLKIGEERERRLGRKGKGNATHTHHKGCHQLEQDPLLGCSYYCGFDFH